MPGAIDPIIAAPDAIPSAPPIPIPGFFPASIFFCLASALFEANAVILPDTVLLLASAAALSEMICCWYATFSASLLLFISSSACFLLPLITASIGPVVPYIAVLFAFIFACVFASALCLFSN